MTENTTPAQPPIPPPVPIAAPESASVDSLARSVRRLRIWLAVLTALVAFLLVTFVAIVTMFAIGFAGVAGFAAADGFAGDQVVKEGPPLSSVASLTVDASGRGVIGGSPTGEASTTDERGTFELALNPTPPGLAANTVVSVAIDSSTKVYRDDRALGDALSALNDENGDLDADPSSAGTAIVHFRVKNGQVFAERIDLSDEMP